MGRLRAWFQGLGRLVILGVTSGVLLMWLVLLNDPENHAALALLLYLPYPVYLLPALASFLWSWCLAWRWRVLATFTLGVAAVVLMGWVWGRADKGSVPVRLMTYNVKAYNAVNRPGGLAEVAAEVQRHNPDVLVMQDAIHLMDKGYVSAQAHQAIFGDRAIYAQGEYIVASRLPIKACHPVALPYNHVSHSFVHCVLVVKGQELDLVTVHFLTPRAGLNATRRAGVKGLGLWRDNVNKRLTQSGVLADQIGLMKRPRIVAGDLNAPERSSVVQDLLDTGMRDAFSAAGRGYGYTHGHSLWPGISLLRIDHVLVSDDIGVARVSVGGTVASEHRPVIADLLMVRE